MFNVKDEHLGFKKRENYNFQSQGPVRSIHDPRLDLTLWGSALLSLESIGMFFIAQNAKTEQQVLHLSDHKTMNGESKSSFKLSNKLDNQIALYMRTFNDELTTI